MAQFERRLIGQRTRDALAVAKAQGVRLGRPQVLRADVVTRIVSERRAGRTMQAIADSLNADGVPTAQGGSPVVAEYGRQGAERRTGGNMSEPSGESVRGRLATCSYRAFRPEMGLAVRITRGHARWRLPYELVGKVGSLAPDATEWALRDDPAGFVAHYRARMDGLTVDGIAAELEAAFPDGRLVLLCFENVWGQVLAPALVCHRRAFAEWWQDRTGDVVPELSDQPQP